MTVDVRITVEDVTTQDDTYNQIQLHSATSAGGTYASVGTATLVATTFNYTITDAAGTLNTWYKYRFYHTVSAAASSFSEPFQPDGVTRLKIRQHALKTYKAGLVLLSTTGGDANSILTNDYRYKNSLYDTGWGKGGWTYPSTGSRAGESRNIIGTGTPSTGQIDVSPDMTGALASGDEFEWHWTADPDVWNECINLGLKRYFYLERVPLVGIAAYEIPLTNYPWITSKRQITGLWWYSTTDANEEPFQGSQRWWNIRVDYDAIYIKTDPKLATTDTAYLEAVRPMPSLALDASVLPNAANLDLCAALAYDEVLLYLMQPMGGNSADRAVYEKARKDLLPKLKALINENRPKPVYALPSFKMSNAVSPPWGAR